MNLALFDKASDKIAKYNTEGLHYNLVADAVYAQLRRLDSPFSRHYLPFIVAALIAFDMGRMMGSGPGRPRYDTAADGFAGRLHKKLTQIQSSLKDLVHHNLFDTDVQQYAERIREAYDILASDGEGRLNLTEKSFRFDVGATKILHFINPEVFIMVDSNVAKALNRAFGIPYRNTTQPGYSSKLYMRSLSVVRAKIMDYGIDRFGDLEPGTPTMRIFDKLAFAHSAFKES